MRPEDLRDLFAYLKTLPAVPGRVRDHDLPFPFSVRRGLGLWKLAFLDGKVFAPDPAKSASWNRGAYLVEGAAHCAECHSARSAIGVIPAERRYAGGPNPEGKGSVPNITSGDSVSSNMVEVVRNTSQLAPADRDAIAEYIKSLPPRVGWKAPK
jgi:mono/diheme cytochrome c family protein